MDLFKTLKQFKKIEPTESYKTRSRTSILLSKQNLPEKTPILRLIMENVQFASAMALMGLFIILATGGFSIFNVLTPFRLSSLDPVNLRAEAQAIDIQIELANVNYIENVSQISSPSKTTSATSQLKTVIQQGIAKNQTSTLSAESTSTEPTIDDVLDVLAN